MNRAGWGIHCKSFRDSVTHMRASGEAPFLLAMVAVSIYFATGKG
jgi:hypothetical protein